jgi:hypothetical protein
MYFHQMAYQEKYIEHPKKFGQPGTCTTLHSSLNVSNRVSHPYKTTGKIMVLYILTFKLLDNKLEDKRFCTK